MPNATIEEILAASPILPVLTFTDPKTATDVCGALISAGIGALEVTLRTPSAVEILRHVRRAFPHVPLGAGTVTRAAQLDTLQAVGLDFVVTPGLTPALADALQSSPMPALPGVATPSEAMAARDRGYEFLKLFPARAVGGVAAVKAFGAVLPDTRFCPTGGIGRDEFRDYLGLGCVAAVGGSWLVDPARVAVGDFDGIRERAAQDMAVARGLP